MLAAAKWIVSVVPAGVVLGALLGGTAAPDMKDAPAPFWRLGGENAFIASSGPAFEVPPDDLSPAGGYRPDLDYDSEAWGSRIAYYEVGALADEPLPDELPTVTYGVTATEAVADQAEAAADEAIAAEAPDPAPAPERAEERKPELVAEGLY